jgi:ATP-dependent DNA helicase RecG
MRTTSEISALLDELDHCTADSLEDQDLDFKEWPSRSIDDGVRLVVEMAVCMANGGGGSVVLGVADKVVGRSQAVQGVPPEVDVNRLRRTIYDSTDPKLTPVFDELRVPEGTGRLLVMHVFEGLPPYTDSSGRAKVRVGTECKPLTGSLRRRIAAETGETDFTAGLLDGPVEGYLSQAAMEALRGVASKERAPTDLLQMSDVDLLSTLGVVRDGRLSRAGLLLLGKDAAIEREVPRYSWTYLRMESDTEYQDRLDGRDPVAIALARVFERVMVGNPITTLRHGLFHFEYRTYPEIALREALMNAFCHADYRMGAPILVKQLGDRLEISNPGAFIGGVTPENILHHTPVSRNPHLVDVLTRLRLVNRSNLGVPRMYFSLLVEGKEPPIIEELGDAVKVTLLAGEMSVAFRAFVEEESKSGRALQVDHLLVLRHLLRHSELETASAARICQRPEAAIREVLSEMERTRGYLERGGTGRGTYWTLSAGLHRQLSAAGHPERDRRIDWEVAKTRVLSVLKQRAERDESGLSNAEIRQITHLNRHQVVRLMHELRSEDPSVMVPGRGKFARYVYRLGQ